MAGVIHSKLGSSIPVGLSWYIVANHNLGRGYTAFCGKGYRWFDWYCLLSFDFKTIRSYRLTIVIILSRNGISTYSKTCNLMTSAIHSKLCGSIPVGLSWYIVTNHSLGRGCTTFRSKGYRWLGWYCLLSFDFKTIRNIRGTTIFFYFYLISTCGKTWKYSISSYSYPCYRCTIGLSKGTSYTTWHIIADLSHSSSSTAFSGKGNCWFVRCRFHLYFYNITEHLSTSTIGYLYIIVQSYCCSS